MLDVALLARIGEALSDLLTQAAHTGARRGPPRAAAGSHPRWRDGRRRNRPRHVCFPALENRNFADNSLSSLESCASGGSGVFLPS